METTALVNFRMNKELKSDMEKVCSDLGLNMTTAFTIFATKMCREKRIPFEVSIDPFYSASNMRNIEKAMQDLDAHKGVSKTMSELEAMEK